MVAKMTEAKIQTFILEREAKNMNEAFLRFLTVIGAPLRLRKIKETL